VLPCVDVFVADEFCVWAPILRTCLALRWGIQLAEVRTCLALRTCLAFALRTCVGAPNLRTCLALRWGTQLADVPHVAFGRPSCGRALRCFGAPNLGEAVLKSLPPSQICSYPSSGSSFSLVLPCVDVFVADEFCVWATILRTCLALRWGAQLADVPWGAQLADVLCVLLGHPTCGCALCCVGAPILRTRLALRWGAQPW
jgi:hypothetical protein